jgi:MFS family permease
LADERQGRSRRATIDKAYDQRALKYLRVVFPHSMLRTLRVRNYRLFAGSFLCSGWALQMLATVVLWDLWKQTGDALVLGIAGLARALPVIALALVAGHASDTFSRKRILIITQMAFIGIAACFAWASWRHAGPSVWYALLALSGCVRSFNGPSRHSLVPLLVPTNTLESAIAWNSGIFQFCAVSGPVIAGSLLQLGMESWHVLALSAVLLGVATVFAAQLDPAEHTPQRRALTLRAMLAGMGHIRRERTILAALTLDLFGVLLGGATALLPIYADEILNGGPALLGWLKAAPYLGALVMAIWLAVRPTMQHAGRSLLLSVALFGLAMIAFGISTAPWLSLLMLFLSGAFDNISVVIRHTLVQMRTPNELRGRVSAVNSLFIECSNELGAFESGLVARMFGPVLSVVSGGVGTLLVVGATALVFPEVRRLQRLVPVSDDEASVGGLANQAVEVDTRLTGDPPSLPPATMA